MRFPILRSFLIIFQVVQFQHVLSLCGYKVINQQPFVMDTCHSTDGASSFKYSCSSNDRMIHQIWNNSLCTGEPNESFFDLDCAGPNCVCGSGSECDHYTVSQTDCDSNDILSQYTLMVNSCFNDTLKYQCPDNGSLILQQFEHGQNTQCGGDMVQFREMNHFENVSECILFSCSNPSEFSISQENMNLFGLSRKETFVCLLIIAAILVVLITLVYCYRLKPPHGEETDERRQHGFLDTM